MGPPVVLASQLLDRLKALSDWPRYPIAPRLVRVFESAFRHYALDRGHTPILPMVERPQGRSKHRQWPQSALQVVAVDVGVAGDEADALVEAIGGAPAGTRREVDGLCAAAAGHLECSEVQRLADAVAAC